MDLAPWVQVVNASVNAWDERHTGVIAGKAAIFQLLQQGMPMRSRNIVFGGDMLDEMCATVVTGIVPRLSALRVESLPLKTQTSGNPVNSMIITVLSQTRGAQHGQTISWPAIPVTLSCLETLLADALGSRSASQGCGFGTSATPDSSAITTSRLTAILAQPRVDARLLGPFVGHVVSSQTSLGTKTCVCEGSPRLSQI